MSYQKFIAFLRSIQNRDAKFGVFTVHLTVIEHTLVIEHYRSLYLRDLQVERLVPFRIDILFDDVGFKLLALQLQFTERIRLS